MCSLCHSENPGSHDPPFIYLIVPSQFIEVSELLPPLARKQLYQPDAKTYVQFIFPLVSQTLYISQVT